ncbi:NTP transferase domain-containing protein [Kaistella sp. G5-32]|uniref:NTP transferase domain-containing protein n=1 Tax=Kaistella gelatinilytica TaxID=2787636 RepID=A0ABS0FCL9_9FLAO|nr:sugar phosphate nucleotidyltransferase [Kaistella gelatinilytica]MBF8457454.1 NTP transferase domain-containing protein [Kaistella gelatinilytica]
MKIIVPMAGRGSRLRPHTLTVPKPLIPIAGKPIVQRLVEDITKVAGEKIDEIAFIIGDFGPEVEASLIKIAEKLGAKGTVYTQDEPLGTAHAIKCAEASMQGDVVVAFADTLFKADFVLDKNSDGVIWVKKVDDPSAFGVVKLDDYGFITDFVEKPKTFVSDLAIIGIYYFNSAEKLMSEINYIMDNDIKVGGEYQLTTALENLRQKGAKFSLGKVDDWMDCGNKNSTVETNGKVLEYERENVAIFPDSSKIENCMIIPPCFIGENVQLYNSKIGPGVSIGNNTKVINSNIDNSLIQENTVIDHGNLSNSMIGNSAEYYGVSREISLGDFSVLDFVSNKRNN